MEKPATRQPLRKKCNMEKHVEKYFKDIVKKAGGKAIKFTSPQETGMPDRIAVFKAHPGITFYVELKYGRNGLSPRQKLVKKELSTFGIEVYVLRSKTEMDAWLKFIKRLA